MAAEKMEKALVEAKDKLTQLNIEERLVSEIEWCLGSYAHDGNPDGLYQKGEEARKALLTYKNANGNSRKISKKLLDDLTRAVQSKDKIRS